VAGVQPLNADAVAAPRVATPRLVLTIAHPGLGPDIARFFRDNWQGHLDRWSPPAGPRLFDVGYWTGRAEAAESEWRAGTAARFVLQRPDGGKVLGTCNYTNIVRGPFQACYLGYQAARAHQGQGFMTEALEALDAFVFREMRLHRIMANYMPENTRSARLLERLGFLKEGLARDYLFIDGVWRDHILAALTNPDFDDAPLREGAA